MCGDGGYGKDDNDDGKVSAGEVVRDMFDGGGKGARGDRFEGGLSAISNDLGATPRGSGKEPTGLAAAFTGVTGIGGRANPGAAAIIGALTGGIPGMALGYASAKGKNAVRDAGGLRGLTGGSDTGPMRPTPRPDQRPMRPTPRPDQRPSRSNMQGGDGEDRPMAARAAELAEANKPAMTMSERAVSGAFLPVPNPNYDPTNPASLRFLSNPSYDQIVAAQSGEAAPLQFGDFPQIRIGMNYNPVLRADPLGFAEGGEVPMPTGAPEGTNEKTLISGAIQAVKGAMPEEQAAIALGMFVQTYGEDALKDLVARVQSGEMDETAARSEGKVAGPGDGMNDRIPASIDGRDDVLLSDGEFIIPADVVSGLGNGSSEAGASELARFMERVRSERTGTSEQPKAINPAAMMPAR